MLSCTSKRSHRHTILHVSFSNSFGLASARPTPQGLSGAPQKPNETALLRKVVDGLKQELERVKNVVYASKEVLNLEEAAMFLGISKSSLYKMTHNQVIPYFKPNNKMVYFEKSELLKWLRQNPVASQGQISEEAHAIMRNLAKND